jgi:ammonium transporter, Amt family
VWLLQELLASYGLPSVIAFVSGNLLGGFVGNPLTHLFFKDVNNTEPWGLAPTIPKTFFSLFQLMFAIITPGLVVGAWPNVVKFTSYILFTIII